MPLVAAAVVDQARDFHHSFDPHRVPEKAAIRQLSRYQARLASKVTTISEDALAVPVRFAKEEVDTAAAAGVGGPGLALPDHILILAVGTAHVSGGRQGPVHLVNYANHRVEAAHLWPAAYLLRGVLYPANRHEVRGYVIKGDVPTPEHGWEELDGIVVTLVPLPPDLTDKESLIGLPGSTQDALVTNLALWMAQRVGLNWPTLQQQAMDAEAAAVAALATQDTTSTWTIT
jgi:hypothetical protein